MTNTEAPKITRYGGDEGSDRLRNPSSNAPHTEAEAHLAVLRSLRRAVEAQRGEVGGKPHQWGPKSSTGRTETQAKWLDNASEDLTAMLLSLIDSTTKNIIADAERPKWQHMDGEVCDKSKVYLHSAEHPFEGICDQHDRRVFLRTEDGTRP